MAQPSQHTWPDTAPLLGTGLGPPHLGDNPTMVPYQSAPATPPFK